MRHILRLLILLPLLLLPGLAGAQVSNDDANRALDVLQDPAKRDQLIQTLQTIARTQPAPPPTEPLVLTPSSLGASVLTGASAFLGNLSVQAVATIGAVRSIPLLWGWLQVMATDPWSQDVLLDTAWRLALILAIGLLVEWSIRRAVQQPILRLIRRAPNHNGPPADESPEARAEHGETEPPPRRRAIAALILLRRVPLVLGRLLLELLPILAFIAVAHLLTATALGGGDLPRVVSLAVIDAYAVCAALLCVARMMFSPDATRLRILAIPDHVAGYAMRWSRRIIVVSVFGYAAAEVGLLLYLSSSSHAALLKLVGLIDHLFLAIIVIQQRRRVRDLLRAPEGDTGVIAGLRNWFALIWHWVALLFLAALWLTWAIEVPQGYTRLLRFVVSTITVAVAARLLQILLLGGLARVMTPPPETTTRNAALEARLAAYHPVLARVCRAVIFIGAVIALLQFWGLGSVALLFGTSLGRHLVSTLLTLILTVLLAIAVWEGVNATLERHLARLTRDAQAARSARLRTLLPLLRTTLLITILIVSGMMVLSEIGVNIGPLLAGAGIVGVAIGFGSQKLVQDLITGIFLLLENAMQVGDSVTVGGLSGTVENLSVRTIRLRAADGSVHIIPFSAVTTVTNVNRGLGNASINVTVAADQDIDQIFSTLREIVAGMREDADFGPRMLSDLQLWGVDRVDGAAATITGQVVCTDSGRWSVQREFNRRMTRRFHELGIRLYNPLMQQVVTMSKPEPSPVP